MESRDAVLQTFAAQLAELARTRKPLELRLLIEIVASGEQELSTRVLADRMRVSRRHLVEAKQALEADGLIVCEPSRRNQGGTWRAACFAQEIVPTGRGAISAPPEEPLRHQGGAISDPPVEPARHQGGARSAPPINKERARAPVDSIDRTLKPDIDRLQKPAQTKYDSEQLRVARNALHSYMLKFGPDPKAKPPDENITTQFLDAGTWPDLENLLCVLHTERKTLYSYAYLVTTAHQRLRHLTPEQEQDRRAALRRKPPQPERELFNQLMKQTEMRGFSR